MKEWLDSLENGDLVEMYWQGNWWAAQIAQIDENKIKISYPGVTVPFFYFIFVGMQQKKKYKKNGIFSLFFGCTFVYCETKVGNKLG